MRVYRRHECGGGEKDSGNVGESDKETTAHGKAAEQAAVPVPARHLHGGEAEFLFYSIFTTV